MSRGFFSNHSSKSRKAGATRKNVRRSKSDAFSEQRSAQADDLVTQSLPVVKGGGASTQLFHSWLSHHWHSALSSLQRLLAEPWQSLMTWSVIAIAIVLPAMLYLGLNNIQQLGQHWQDNRSLSVYLQVDASPLAIEKLQARWEMRDDIASIILITPEEAKRQFQLESGLGEVLDSLDHNPLPAVLVVQPTVLENDLIKHLSDLQQSLATDPLVETIQFDTQWLQRLYNMMGLAQRIVLILGVLLAFGVLLSIGNTIRLTIENSRNEIVVIKLVGGTNGFVRRPFLYTGLWYGLGGGVLAIFCLMVAGQWLESPINHLIASYDAQYALVWLSGSAVFSILCLAAFLGWLGAGLAVARHLKHIEPA